MQINWGSILKKLETNEQTTKFQKKKDEVVNKIMLGKMTLSSGGAQGTIHTPEEAAMKFIEVLSYAMDSHVGSNYSGGQISKLARDALTGLEYGKAYKYPGETDVYHIDIWFDVEKHRESLDPKKYPEGIDNIIALLNSGYDASGSVWGVWTDHKGNRSTDELGNVVDIPSLPHREGSHFIEQAIRDFLGNYGSEYNVFNIEPDPVYNIRTN